MGGSGVSLDSRLLFLFGLVDGSISFRFVPVVIRYWLFFFLKMKTKNDLQFFLCGFFFTTAPIFRPFDSFFFAFKKWPPFSF